ncbi:MAG: hypothetical protein AAGA38_10095 [Pseudomonadota bacterium]
MQKVDLDRFVEKVFSAKPSGTQIDDLKTFFKTQSKNHDFSETGAVFRYMDDLDNKSSALLTHVSMLIAAVSIMLTVFENTVGDIFLLLEAAVYVAVATGLLRCINIVRPGFPPEVNKSALAAEENTEDYVNAMVEEAGIRLIIYTKARVITLYATLAFLAGIVVKLLFG